MKSKHRTTWICFAVAAVFFIQLIRGFAPPVNHTDPGGAGNEPVAVVFSAILAGFLIFALLEILCWIYSKMKK